jgi:hypothetical protein
MNGMSDPRATAPLQNQVMPAFIQSKINEAVAEAVADLQRHNQQLNREETRPRHSPSPYERRHPSADWRPRDRMRGEEAGHRRSEAPRRDHHLTEEYDPRGNDLENNYLKSICPQGLKISPSSLTALFDYLSI